MGDIARDPDLDQKPDPRSDLKQVTGANSKRQRQPTAPRPPRWNPPVPPMASRERAAR